MAGRRWFRRRRRGDPTPGLSLQGACLDLSRVSGLGGMAVPGGGPVPGGLVDIRIGPSRVRCAATAANAPPAVGAPPPERRGTQAPLSGRQEREAVKARVLRVGIENGLFQSRPGSCWKPNSLPPLPGLLLMYFVHTCVCRSTSLKIPRPILTMPLSLEAHRERSGKVCAQGTDVLLASPAPIPFRYGRNPSRNRVVAGMKKLP